MTIERPDFVTDEHLIYLDRLRDSGVTNMFGAARFLEDQFPVRASEARKILIYWMETFSERHQSRKG